MARAQRVPYVCFHCQIATKREAPYYYEEQPAVLSKMAPDCPRCHQKMAFLGRYFKVPPSGNLKQWRKAQLLWENGWEADGYSAGPKTLRDAKEHLSGREVRAQKTQAECTKTEQKKTMAPSSPS